MPTILERLEGSDLPPLILTLKGLRYLNPEHGYSDDGPFTLELPYPHVALISADDRRGTRDGSPPYRKFHALSQAPVERTIITSYLVYTCTRKVKVESWNPEKVALLEGIDMEHYDITPDKAPDRLLKRHLERIAGESSLVVDNLRAIAEKTFFDILWNIKSF